MDGACSAKLLRLLFRQILRDYVVVLVVLAWRRSRSQVGTQVFVSKATSSRFYLSQSEAELLQKASLRVQ